MVTRLCDIKPGDSDLTTRARICRIWRGKMLMNIEKNDGMQCVLVDRNNNAIHAIVSEVDYEDVLEKIELGHLYEITNFHASDNQTYYIVVPHQSQLMFNNRTTFVPLPEVYPPYPRYWFQFVDYDELHKRKGKDTILTDVIGIVDTVHGVEDVPLERGIAPKRSIDLRDLRGNIFTVNLWGTMGVTFDVAAIERELYPVVIVFTITKVRSFNGKINVSSGMSTCTFLNPSMHETEQYKRRFIGPAYAPKFITDEPTREPRPKLDISKVQIMSIKNLNMKRTTAEKNKQKEEKQSVSFFIKGEITKIMCKEDWHYLGCPKCLKQVKQQDGYTPYCLTHEDETGQPMYKLQVRVEDESDSATIMAIGKGGEFLFGVPCDQLMREESQIEKNTPPAALMKLMGQTRIIEVVYGSRNDFVIKSVHLDNDKREAQSSSLATLEKTAPKRTFMRSKAGASEISQQEATKKQKGQSDHPMTQKLKQVDDQQISEQTQRQNNTSDDDEDFTLSQLFNQQISKKKTSGQSAKALVIDKKTSQQTSKAAMGEEKRSEQIRNKNKSKME